MKKLKDYHSYRYHELTKHSVATLYSEPHYLDWENQPNPFRIYQETERIPLDHGEKSFSGNFFEPPPIEKNQLITKKVLSHIFYYSLSISAWKKYVDSSWHLRVNPSAGNLHPEETHLIACNVEGLKPGIYHYNVFEHLLEMRCMKPLELNDWGSVGIDKTVEKFSAFLVINVIAWRQAWKYQRRALRYCFHDAGHAIGSIQYVLEQMKLDFKVFVKIDSINLKKLLGLQSGDEFPLIVIGLGNTSSPHKLNKCERLFMGKANALSETEVTYPLIEEIKSLNVSFEELNSHKQINPSKSFLSTKINPLKTIPFKMLSEPVPSGLAAGSLNSPSSSKVKNFFTMVRSRRSAQAYDQKTEMELDALSLILKKAFLGPKMDYDLNTSSLIDLYLFVHRIKGLERGLYLYDKSEHQLFLLQNGNIESTASSLSLSQEIASDSSVCFAMIANFSLAFSLLGEIGYRAIHFEVGRIGQALYLGSESLNYNSTGIGAFFDDDVNRFLQLREGYEVIYHFAMGKAIPDMRIQTLDGYYHLNRPGEN